MQRIETVQIAIAGVGEESQECEPQPLNSHSSAVPPLQPEPAKRPEPKHRSELKAKRAKGAA